MRDGVSVGVCEGGRGEVREGVSGRVGEGCIIRCVRGRIGCM